MMNPEVKELWVEALTSGRFKKGRNFLAKNGKHCCLGVLCELAIENGVSVGRMTDERGVVFFDGIQAYLPPSVLYWAGLAGSHPQVVLDGKSRPLGVVNDGSYEVHSPKPFRSIAKLIKEQL